MEILEIVIKLNMIIEFLTDILEILTDILEISNCCMYYKYAESFFFFELKIVSHFHLTAQKLQKDLLNLFNSLWDQFN